MKNVVLLAVAIIAISIGPAFANPIGHTFPTSIEPAFANSIGPASAKLDSVEYLFHYGYLETINPTPEELTKAYLTFQRMYKLPLSGMMDEQTFQQMILPRCGVADIINGNQKLSEYKLVMRWRKNLIDWRITKYSKTSALSDEEQRDAIIRALNRWSAVTPLVFREITGFGEINMSFEKKVHGFHVFSWRELAHATFPPFKGEIHFSEDINWILGNNNGYDLETTAAHEIGHALGLNHSSDPTALMYSTYRKKTANYTLGSDDIAGIQALYGPKPTKIQTKKTRLQNPRKTQTKKTPLPKGFCDTFYKNIEAVMRISGKDLVFVDSGAVIDGRDGEKIMEIPILFPGGPQSVQAAVYSNEASKAYLFHNKKVWAYSLDSIGLFHLVKDFPKDLPNSQSQNLECAMKLNYHDSELILLIKNGSFVFFTPDSESVDLGRVYPTHDTFRNIPEKIDAAISSDDTIYFIVKEKAYKMLTIDRVVDTSQIPVKSAFNECRNNQKE